MRKSQYTQMQASPYSSVFLVFFNLSNKHAGLKIIPAKHKDAKVICWFVLIRVDSAIYSSSFYSQVEGSKSCTLEFATQHQDGRSKIFPALPDQELHEHQYHPYKIHHKHENCEKKNISDFKAIGIPENLRPLHKPKTNSCWSHQKLLALVTTPQDC